MAKLIVNPTSTNRREILLSRSMILTIGRDPSNDLVLADAMVSRRHAVVEHRGSQYFLRDCNSVNGSVVNGDRVGERVLRDGDLVAIGSMRLLFREELEEGGTGKVVQHPSAAPLECPSCHASYRRGDLYCRECGAQVAQPSGPPRAVCPSCATAVPLPARFCNACGAPLAADGQRLGEDEASSPPASRDTGPEVAPAFAAGSMAIAPQARSEPSPRTAPGTPAPAERRLPERRGPLPARAGTREGAPAATPAPPATRLVAFLTDAVFVVSAQAIMLAPVAWYWSYRPRPAAAEDVAFLPVLASVALVPLAALAGVLYHVYFWAVRGATPGKEMFGLRVEDEAGRSPIGLARAARRALGYLLCVASLGIGFAMVAGGGAGLHDRIAGTRVVRTARR